MIESVLYVFVFNVQFSQFKIKNHNEFVKDICLGQRLGIIKEV